MNRQTLILVFGLAACGGPQDTSTSGTPIEEHASTPVHTIKTIPRALDSDGADARKAVVEASDGLFQALSDTTSQLPVWQTPLPEDASIDDILNPERAFDASLSRGSVSSGTMINPVNLEAEGDHHEIIARHRKRSTNWGTKELIDVLKHGAYAVSTSLGGAKLQVGNLSQKRGGDIRWSRSHNSGRDADIAFYVLDENGASVPLPDLATFDENGSCKAYPKLRFDVARNWKLVEAFVTHDVGVQWLFISLPLKKLLLDHARDKDVDPEIIARAELVLHQPTDALPHDDHIHVRIACPVKDRIEGCLPSGPDWPWLPDTNPQMLARVKTLLDEIEHGKRAEEALEFLREIRAPQRAEIALHLITTGKRPELHKKAISIARGPFFWRPYALHQTAQLLNDPSSPHLDDALFIGRRALDPITWDALRAQANNKELSAKQRAKYVSSMIHWANADLIDDLVPMLGEDRVLAQEALVVLQHLTNHPGPASTVPKKLEKRQALIASWKAFAETETRDVDLWQTKGFIVQGVKDPGSVDALISHLDKAPTFGAYNANRRLRELTGRWSPLEFVNVQKIQERWKKWFDQNRDRLLVAQFYPQVFTREYENFSFASAEDGWWKRSINFAPDQESLFASNP